MNLKYFEWEPAPFKERLKNISIKPIADVLFENQTMAYRFAWALSLVKSKGALKLKDCPPELPASTWKRYLDYGVRIGMLKHEDQTYYLTNRFTLSAKNFADYFAKWEKEGAPEEVHLLYPLAKKGKERPRRANETSENGENEQK